MNHWSGWVGLSGVGVALVMALCMHALCDGLQGRLSGLKRRKLPDGSSKAWKVWLPWLFAHGAFHGLGVALALGAPIWGLAELIAHAGIDWGKCEGRYGAWVDQALHVGCKIAWVAGWWAASASG